MVVIPTGTHVDLHYGWTGLDLGAWAVTALGLVALAFLARRRPVGLPAPPAPPAEEYVDPFVVDRPIGGRLEVALPASSSVP